MNQRNFILFTVYQQTVGNVIAMHRDVHTPRMADRLPLWYRKTFVDVAIQLPAGGRTESADGAGMGPQADVGDGGGGKGEHVKGGSGKRSDESHGRVSGGADAASEEKFNAETENRLRGGMGARCRKW